MEAVLVTMSKLLIEQQSIDSLIARSLEAEVQRANVTPITYPHDTGWRTMPWLIVAQIVGGPSTLHLEGSGAISLRSRDAICVGAGIKHRFHLREGSSGVSRWSHLRFTIFDSIDVLGFLRPPPVLTGSTAQAVGNLNAALTKLGDHGGFNPSVRRKALAFSILDAITQTRREPSADLDGVRSLARLYPALAEIDSRLDDPELVPADLAASLGLSYSQFHSIFKKALGVPPAFYIRRRRMLRAEQLLIGSQQKIHEVAARCGWSDQFHFSRIFKQYHGEAPLAYRARAAQSRW